MSTNSKRFHKNNEFPNEAFVQQAIEAYFTAEDFQIEQGGYSDLVCCNGEHGHRWIIEAKGQTSAVGLDFRTGLGQLLQAMQDPTALYGPMLRKRADSRTVDNPGTVALSARFLRR